MPVNRHWIGFKNKKVGDFTESLVQAALNRLGFVLVEKVNTPWCPVRQGGRIVSAFVKDKVSGDFRAVEPGTGRSVLVESKASDTDTLPWSRFEPHQVIALNQHHMANGLSMIAWVRQGVVHLIEWPVPGFQHGKSLLFGSIEGTGRSSDAIHFNHVNTKPTDKPSKPPTLYPESEK